MSTFGIEGMAPEMSRLSNLQRFLNRTTTSVPVLSRSKACSRDSDSSAGDEITDPIEYFSLGDLWDQYYVSSVYGAGVPLRLKNGEIVEQYYVPYLSGIQIYTTKFRDADEDCDSDSWSDDDSGSEKLYLPDESVFGLDGALLPGDHGYLYLQHFDKGPLCGRMPFANKVCELAESYPGLINLKSLDLSPASWMAVAWYPIYQIPTRRSKGLSTNFLTFHRISLPFQDNIRGYVERVVCGTDTRENGRNSNDLIDCISFPPFGLSTYKIQGSLWVKKETEDPERIASLRRAARSWLDELHVEHPDFNYFSSRSD